MAVSALCLAALMVVELTLWASSFSDGAERWLSGVAVALIHVVAFVGAWLVSYLASRRRTVRNLRGLLGCFPAGTFIALVLWFMIAGGTFMLFAAQSSLAGPSCREGHYALVSHGREIRPLKAEECHALERLEARFVIGYMVWFTGLAAALAFGCRRTESTDAAPPAAATSATPAPPG